MKRPDRSENYKEMLQSLKDKEYDSFEEFMEEAGNLLKTDGLTTRHYRLLKDAALKHFGKKFELKYKQRGIQNIQSIVMRGNTLEDALRNFLDWCMDNDETGIFFELSNADMNWVEKNPKVYRVKVPGYEECGIELEDYKEITESVNIQESVDKILAGGVVREVLMKN